jgi:hypothetical protein
MKAYLLISGNSFWSFRRRTHDQSRREMARADNRSLVRVRLDAHTGHQRRPQCVGLATAPHGRELRPTA